MSGFEGFPASGMEFLTELPKRNKKWFDNNRKTYESGLAAPAKQFVDCLGPILCEEISTGITAQARVNGSIAPINNDVRFSKDKSPYKDHLLFRFWEGAEKKTAPTLFVRLAPNEIGFASGVAFADAHAWRAAIDDNKSGKKLDSLLNKLAKKYSLDVAGAELKRVPAPFNADHDRAGLLRHKMFQVRFAKPAPKAFGRSAFAPWCARQLQELADVHRWLVEYMP